MEQLNPKSLIKLRTLTMPYGKYKGLKLIDLPESYVLWSYENQACKGELAKLMSELYEIKVNGLEELIKSLDL